MLLGGILTLRRIIPGLTSSVPSGTWGRFLESTLPPLAWIESQEYDSGKWLLIDKSPVAQTNR